MAIKCTTEKDVKLKIPKYPILKEYKTADRHFVVLFTEPLKGVVVKSFINGAMPEGHYGTGWNESEFTKIDYPITLENI